MTQIIQLGNRKAGETITVYWDNPVDVFGAALTLSDWKWRSALKSSATQADPGLGMIYSPSNGITFPSATRVAIEWPAATTAGVDADTELVAQVWITNIADTTKRYNVLDLTVVIEQSELSTTP